jgi:hypothetical protein
MDIDNMQNFKSFLLKEDAGNYPQLNIWTAMVDEKIPAKYSKQFKSAIQYHIAEKEHMKVIEAGPDSENFYVCIDLRQPSDFVKCSRFVDTIRDICEGFGQIEMGSEDIYCEWPPAFPIETPNYIIKVQLTKETTSKEFGKYIKSVETLSIQSTKYLTGFLGLMSLNKKVRFLEFDLANPEFYKAEKIIQEHFASDRDVLECQEELITNGLKQYAKF